MSNRIAQGGCYVNETIIGGTENADKAGFFQRPSGRILFSDELKVQVE